jgi:hypothetical protein
MQTHDNKTQSLIGSRARILSLALVATATIALPATADQSDSGKGKPDKLMDGGKPVCSKQAQHLFKSCLAQANASRWLEIADCSLIADGAALFECAVGANMQHNTDKLACREQREQRRGICDATARGAYTGWEGYSFQPGELIDGNELLPLAAGVTEYSTGDGSYTREVTDSIRSVDGVDCRVVIELESNLEGVLVEQRELLLAEDSDGNIWNCGALVQQYAQLDAGADPVVVGTEGSWSSGSDGAKAGMAMPAQPVIGAAFRTAFAPGIVEDLAEVIDPAAIEAAVLCEADCTVLRTTSPLSDGHRDSYYRTVEGLVYSEDQAGGSSVSLSAP